MAEEIRVAVVGGGIWGCSIAYQLTLAGIRDVVVFEKDQLASGNTPMAAGLVGQLRSTAFMGRTIGWVVRELERFEATTGHDPGFRQVGSLKVALTEGRARELEQQVELARAWGLAVEFLTPSQAEARAPLLEAGGVRSVVWVPSDGYVEPYGLAMAFSYAARDRGARFRTQTPVTAIHVTNGRASGITAGGTLVRAEHVVVAAGPWGELIAAWLGLELPAVPIRHQHWITAPTPLTARSFPVIRVPDAGSYIRPEVGGALVGGFEANPVSYRMADLPPTLQMDQIPEDREVLIALGTHLFAVCPALALAPVMKGTRGLPTFTPDGQYAIGEAPGVRNLWVATGCNAIGIAGSLVIGRWFAELISQGRTGDDLSSMTLTRFGSRYGDRRVLVKDCESIYANFYSLDRGAF
ncbi:MAG: NAD(P)/FAD-dependent oxidoreductase [Candidatus Methylomirabilia bacterium]